MLNDIPLHHRFPCKFKLLDSSSEQLQNHHLLLLSVDLNKIWLASHPINNNHPSKSFNQAKQKETNIRYRLLPKLSPVIHYHQLGSSIFVHLTNKLCVQIAESFESQFMEAMGLMMIKLLRVPTNEQKQLILEVAMSSQNIRCAYYGSFNNQQGCAILLEQPQASTGAKEYSLTIIKLLPRRQRATLFKYLLKKSCLERLEHPSWASFYDESRMVMLEDKELSIRNKFYFWKQNLYEEFKRFCSNCIYVSQNDALPPDSFQIQEPIIKDDDQERNEKFQRQNNEQIPVSITYKEKNEIRDQQNQEQKDKQIQIEEIHHQNILNSQDPSEESNINNLEYHCNQNLPENNSKLENTEKLSEKEHTAKKIRRLIRKSHSKKIKRAFSSKRQYFTDQKKIVSLALVSQIYHQTISGENQNPSQFNLFNSSCYLAKEFQDNISIKSSLSKSPKLHMRIEHSQSIPREFFSNEKIQDSGKMDRNKGTTTQKLRLTQIIQNKFEENEREQFFEKINFEEKSPSENIANEKEYYLDADFENVELVDPEQNIRSKKREEQIEIEEEGEVEQQDKRLENAIQIEIQDQDQFEQRGEKEEKRVVEKCIEIELQDISVSQKAEKENPRISSQQEKENGQKQKSTGKKSQIDIQLPKRQIAQVKEVIDFMKTPKCQEMQEQQVEDEPIQNLIPGYQNNYQKRVTVDPQNYILKQSEYCDDACNPSIEFRTRKYSQLEPNNQKVRCSYKGDILDVSVIYRKDKSGKSKAEEAYLNIHKFQKNGNCSNMNQLKSKIAKIYTLKDKDSCIVPFKLVPFVDQECILFFSEIKSGSRKTYPLYCLKMDGSEETQVLFQFLQPLKDLVKIPDQHSFLAINKNTIFKIDFKKSEAKVEEIVCYKSSVDFKYIACPQIQNPHKIQMITRNKGFHQFNFAVYSEDGYIRLYETFSRKQAINKIKCKKGASSIHYTSNGQHIICIYPHHAQYISCLGKDDRKSMQRHRLKLCEREEPWSFLGDQSQEKQVQPIFSRIHLVENKIEGEQQRGVEAQIVAIEHGQYIIEGNLKKTNLTSHEKMEHSNILDILSKQKLLYLEECQIDYLGYNVEAGRLEYGVDGEYFGYVVNPIENV